MKLMQFQLWLTRRYSKSSWVRLAFILVLVAGSNLTIYIMFKFLPLPEWALACIALMWMLLWAGFGTWLVTAWDYEEMYGIKQ